MTSNKDKLEFIFSIDRWLPLVKNSVYEKELKDLRRKYIYKDVSTEDFKKDLEFIDNIKSMLWYFETEKTKRYEKQI
jgi:hypothetical protein